MYEGMPLTLAEVNLKTGRTHQIRVQFASRKLPLYGDGRYGAGTSLPGGRIALWSHVLIFARQGEQSGKNVRSVPPDEFPWNLFPTLEKLRSGTENE
jgi:23S rRNA pseudouridine1911/1915/1917 synthase